MNSKELDVSLHLNVFEFSKHISAIHSILESLNMILESELIIDKDIKFKIKQVLPMIESITPSIFDEMLKHSACLIAARYEQQEKVNV